jgi:hypothetical protein
MTATHTHGEGQERMDERLQRAADPDEDVDPSVPPTVVEGGSGSAAQPSVHAGGSMYGCPACQRVEDRKR